MHELQTIQCKIKRTKCTETEGDNINNTQNV